MEQLVSQLLPAYAGFLQQLLKPKTANEGARQRSLVNQRCNPQLDIVVCHCDKEVHTIRISPTKHGESVLVSYSENREWRLHERWRAVTAAGGVECEQVLLAES
jgi:hypothetical protein